MRCLVYKIKKNEWVNYVFMNIEMKVEVINELNFLFEKDECVIWYMCIF